MPLTNSSLAMAAETLSVALQGALTDITVLVGSPMQAKAAWDLDNTKHYLNIFFYRVAPSGFHAAQTSDDPLFVRVAALLTPFPAKTVNNTESHAALRILGEVMRHFHENPVGEVLPTAGAPAHLRTPHRIEAALQAPTMEELNHIWTTQGSEVGYQMSAAYEFALIPIDPLVAATPAGEVLTTQVQVGTDTGNPAGPQDYDLEFTAYPAADTDWPGPPHLPQMLFQSPDGPSGQGAVAHDAGEIAFALSGAKGSKAQILLSVRDGAGAELRRADGVFTINAVTLDDAQARVTVPVSLTGAAEVVAEVRQTDETDAALVPDRVGNTLTLTVEGGP